MEDLSPFINDVLDDFDNNITDAVFCYLQCNRELMTRYFALIRQYENGKQVINSRLAQAIANRYGLRNANRRNDMPNSMLIDSFSELEEI